MKFNNVDEIFSTNLTNIHQCLEKILFLLRSESKKIPTKKKIQFNLKKVFFAKHLWMLVKFVEKFCVTSCKNRTLMDKNCGNESQICLTLKIRRFTPIFLHPGFLTKKTSKMGTLLISFFPIFLTKKLPILVNSRKKPIPTNSAHK
jgi:hypothetical protein